MRSTYKVIEKWFDCLENKRYDELLDMVDENVHWVNCRPVPGVNDVVPWLGEFYTKADVIASFERFGSAATPVSFTLHDIHVDGEFALSHVHEVCEVLKNGKTFEVNDIFKMQVKDGKVVYWESFWDPSGAIKAFTETGE
ncbi:conserved hypothetical protein [Xylanimonas cellulosilytica DSM 15894]|uniref:SnoaL-like domain-containing protein n=1 Tax=Xylanimonas cellulosilytica (strain DSM 15894 / JCM 12276 / CECT 5975 / KCTC 9989 / LMG 20990 / NBRC 107835 / XIL07) TaxID=446471 RepID=D1BYK5_XYLCX|nr:nuclear transport factor 2 family protein [Xylanimonas cellulosilytica]ACZ31877.1 conserved hypothetical protein [Xylanimonas cellulosilytica DSM 15894]